jgi:hypothetical protein
MAGHSASKTRAGVPAIGSGCGYLEEAALSDKRCGASEATSFLGQERRPELLLPESA